MRGGAKVALMAETSDLESGARRPSTLPRRSFLKVGLLGTVVAALGGVGLALRGALLRKIPAGGLKVLSEKEYSILAAVMDRICPDLGEKAPGAAALDIASKADEAFAKLDEGAQKEFKILLGVFESALAGFLFEGRLTPFTKLSPEDQDESLRRWGNSRIGFRRSGYQALRGLSGALYYGDPRMWKNVGYPGPPWGVVTPAREARKDLRAAIYGGLEAGGGEKAP